MIDRVDDAVSASITIDAAEWLAKFHLHATTTPAVCERTLFLMVVDDQTPTPPDTTSVPVMLSVRMPASVWPSPSEIL